MPACWQAAAKASKMSHLSRCFSTRHSPFRAVKPLERRIAPRVEPPVALVDHEVRQRLLPRPVVLAGELRPGVVVAGLAAHVDHAVDRRAAAQHLATGIAQAPPVQPRHRLGHVHPVGARVADAVEIPDRNPHPVVGVRPARLDQQHPPRRVSAQPVGEQAAGGPGADHDMVELRVHRSFLGHSAARLKRPRRAWRFPLASAARAGIWSAPRAGAAGVW